MFGQMLQVLQREKRNKMPRTDITIDVTLVQKKRKNLFVVLTNWVFTILKSNYSLIDITEIQYVCNFCENNDVDCSVVGGNDGVLVVYVRRCQNCENES